MELKRRDFLKLLGVVTGGVAVTGAGFNPLFGVPEKLIELAKNGPGIETWTNTICGQCPGGCGLKVRCIDNIPVYIKGNPKYPVNQGGMCPAGHGALEVLYNPDRLKGPLRRVGMPRSGKWEPVSWDEALDLVGKKLLELRNAGKPQQLAFLDGRDSLLMSRHIARFMEAFGSPNHFRLSPQFSDAVPFMLQHGHAQLPAYDLLNSKYILSFGANFLEEGYSPVYYTKLYSRLRGLEDGNRVRLVQVDSRMSLTAANADRWIPIRPGSYGALALGIAYVLIREEMVDDQFLAAHTLGYEDWQDDSGTSHLGYKSMVLGNYFPDKVSRITGVAAETILEIARELGNTRPAVVLGNQGAVNNTNGTYNQMAVHSLNALLGNFEQDGGVFFTPQQTFSDLPEVLQDKVARNGNRQVRVDAAVDAAYPHVEFAIESFTANVLAETSCPVGVLFLSGGNPLFPALNHHEFSEALRKIPLVVSFDSFVNETNEHADLILPDHSFLEKWDEVSGTPTVGFAHAGIRRPVVEPLYDTRNTGDVLIDLAARLGGTVKQSFPFKSYKELVRLRMKSIYEAGQGAIASEGVHKDWLEYLQQRGWHIGRYSSFEEFWDLLLDQGGWWNPIREPRELSELFQTPSGKFELYSQRLRDSIHELASQMGGEKTGENLELVLNRLNISARGDTVFLPHHEMPPADDKMPLYLTTFQLLTNRDGDGANQPMMQEMFGYTARHYWRSWAEIHPQTAAEYGISDGKMIWVESGIGSLKVLAKVHPGIVPGVVSIPFGLGHTSYGRYAKGYGVNPNTIMINAYDLINGKPALQATRVKISVVA